MRLFIGIDLPSEQKRKLLELQAKLKQAGVNGIWKSPNNFHLTLEFLGETESSKVDRVVQVLRALAHAHRAFVLNFQGIGFFPTNGKPKILWTGVGGEIDNLLMLQADINKNMLQAGFNLESRRYTPHVTLAARPFINGMDLSTFENIVVGEFLVNRFSLIESSVTENKRVYSPVQHFYLH